MFSKAFELSILRNLNRTKNNDNDNGLHPMQGEFGIYHNNYFNNEVR
jgi:hypothetical protein